MSVSLLPSTDTNELLYYDAERKCWSDLNDLGEKGWKVMTISHGIAYLEKLYVYN